MNNKPIRQSVIVQLTSDSKGLSESLKDISSQIQNLNIEEELRKKLTKPFDDLTNKKLKLDSLIQTGDLQKAQKMIENLNIEFKTAAAGLKDSLGADPKDLQKIVEIEDSYSNAVTNAISKQKELTNEIKETTKQLKDQLSVGATGGLTKKQKESAVTSMSKSALSGDAQGIESSYQKSINLLKKRKQEEIDNIKKTAEYAKLQEKIVAAEQKIAELKGKHGLGEERAVAKTELRTAQKNQQKYVSSKTQDIQGNAIVSERDLTNAKTTLTDQANKVNENLTKKAEAQTIANEQLKKSAEDVSKAYSTNVVPSIEKADSAFDGLEKSAEQGISSLKKTEDIGKGFSNLGDKIKQLTGATMIFMQIRRAVGGAISDFKELDKQFNEISIVSNKNMKEMWDSFSTVNKTAQEYGVTTQNVVAVQKLYYEQGKSSAQVNALTNETLKLAKISGLDYSDATDKMTAALNAYRISAEDAGQVTDVFAALSARAAASSEEIANALTKTASIAANAGMTLQSTSAFLTKMIETTRESSENLGTALKTITARFTELKTELKTTDEETGEIVSANKVETALATAGVALRDTAGQFRNVDQVIMDLSAKWDTLDRNTQRYIATTAAGSRQQSRFIAMVEDHSRLLELQTIANEAAGTGNLQLAKSMDSIETATNRLDSAWQEFYNNFLSSDFFKWIIDSGRGILQILNDMNSGVRLLTISLGLLGAKLITALSKKALDAFAKKIIDTGKKVSQYKPGWGKFFGEQEARKASAAQDNFSKIVKKTMSAKEQEIKLAQAQERINKASIITTKEGSAIDLSRVGSIKKKRIAISDLERVYASLNKEQQTALLSELSGISVEELADRSEEGRLQTLRDLNLEKIKGVKATDSVIVSDFTSSRVTDQGTESTKANIREKITQAIQAKLTSIAVAGGASKEALASGTVKAAKEGENITWWGNVAAKLSANAATIVGIGAAIASLAAITAITAAVTSLSGAYGDNTDNILGNSESLDDYNEAVAGNKDEITKLKSLSTDYNRALELQGLGVARTKEQTEEYQQLLTTLSENYPSLVKYMGDGTKELDNSENAYNDLVTASENLINANKQVIASNQDLAASFGGIIEGTKASVDLLNTKAVGRQLLGPSGLGTESQIKKDYSESFYEVIKQIGDEGVGPAAIAQLGNIKDMTNEQYQDILISFRDGLDSAYKNTDLGKFYNILNDSQRELFAKFGEELSSGEYKNAQQFESNFTDLATIAAKNQQTAAKDSNITKALLNATTDENGDIIYGAFSKDAVEEFYKTFNDSQTASIEKAFIDFTNSTTNKTPESFMKDTVSKIADFEGGEDNSIYKLLLQRAQQLVNERKKNKDKLSNLLSGKGESQLGLDKNSFEAEINNLTADQTDVIRNQIANIMKDSGKESAIEFAKQYLDTLKQSLTTEQLQAITTVDWSDSDSIAKQRVAFQKLGGDLKVFDALWAKSGSEAKKKWAGYTDTLTALKDRVNKITTAFEKLNSAIDGSLDFDGFTELLTTIPTLKASDFQITGTGFKLSDEKAIQAKKDALMYEKMQNEAELVSLKTRLASIEVLKDFNTELYNSLSLKAASSRLTAEEAKEYDKLKTTFNGLSEANKALVNDYTDVKKAIEAQSAAALYLDAQAQQKELDKRIEKLQKIVDLLKEIDGFSNLNSIQDMLSAESANLEVKVELTSNVSTMTSLIKQQIDNMSKQIALAQAKANKSGEFAKQYQKEIQKGYSKYVSFDKEGNLIENYKEIERLSKQIGNADEGQAKALEQRYNNLKEYVSKYREYQKQQKESTKAMQDQIKAQKDLLNGLYANISTAEDKIRDLLIKRDEDELNSVQKRYAAMKSADDDYLKKVQENIQKERDLRSRTENYESLQEQENKLALLQMDTSGKNASAIAELEKSLSDQRQQLQDQEVDNLISQLQEENTAKAIALDEDLAYQTQVLEYKKINLVAYNAEVKALLLLNKEDLIANIKELDTEFTTSTFAAQQLWEQDWETVLVAAQSSAQVLANTGIKQMQTAIEKVAAASSNKLEPAIQNYTDKITTTSEDNVINIGAIQEAYEKLANKGVQSVISKMKELESAARLAADAVWQVQNADSNGALGNTGSGEKNNKPSVGSSTLKGTMTGTYGGFNTKTGTASSLSGYNGFYDQSELVYNKTMKTYTPIKGAKVYQKGFTEGANTKKEGGASIWYLYGKNGGSQSAGTGSGPDTTPQSVFKLNYDQISPLDTKIAYYDSVDDYYNTEKSPLYGVYFPNSTDTKGKYRIMKGGVLKSNYGWNGKVFATGGMVDYTGPAWVDGTKSKPEAFLSAADTENIASLTSVLSMYLSPSKTAKEETIQNNGINNYEIHINVDKVEDKYDVDDFISDTQDSIVEASTKNQPTPARTR